MVKVALGRLGWSEDQALDCDVNSLLLAWEGRQEADSEFYRVIYSANGVKLPEPPPKKRPGDAAAGLKRFAQEHNARWEARKSRASQKTRSKVTVAPEAGE